MGASGIRAGRSIGWRRAPFHALQGGPKPLDQFGKWCIQNLPLADQYIIMPVGKTSFACHDSCPEPSLDTIAFRGIAHPFGHREADTEIFLLDPHPLQNEKPPGNTFSPGSIQKLKSLFQSAHGDP